MRPGDFFPFGRTFWLAADINDCSCLPSTEPRPRNMGPDRRMARRQLIACRQRPNHQPFAVAVAARATTFIAGFRRQCVGKASPSPLPDGIQCFSDRPEPQAPSTKSITYSTTRPRPRMLATERGHWGPTLHHQHPSIHQSHSTSPKQSCSTTLCRQGLAL
jgi:hypothetical protein